MRQAFDSQQLVYELNILQEQQYLVGNKLLAKNRDLVMY